MIFRGCIIIDVDVYIRQGGYRIILNHILLILLLDYGVSEGFHEQNLPILAVGNLSNIAISVSTILGLTILLTLRCRGVLNFVYIIYLLVSKYDLLILSEHNPVLEHLK